MISYHKLLFMREGNAIGSKIFKLVMDEDHYVNIVNTSIQWKDMVEKYGKTIYSTQELQFCLNETS